MLPYGMMVVSAALMVVWVYHYDRYEKEPAYAIVLAIVAGFGAMWVIGRVDDGALALIPQAHVYPIVKALLVALIEEGGKLVTILVFGILLYREFNDPMDGLIYGRLIGLGMAINESLLYLSLSPPTLSTAGSEIVRLLGHSLMGGLVGFAIGLGGHPLHRRKQYPMLAGGCLLTSMVLHFGWDYAAYAPPSPVIQHLAPMVMMAVMLLGWTLLCNVAQARSKEIFAPNPEASSAV
jgi:protease PrsW